MFLWKASLAFLIALFFIPMIKMNNGPFTQKHNFSYL